MRDGYWVVRTYQAGTVGEKTKFWVPGARPKKTSRKTRAEIKKQEQNEHSSEKALARLLNANFHAGDLLLGLDYSQEGMKKLEAHARKICPEFDRLEEALQMDLIREASEHEMRLAIRRVQREMGDTELKYVWIASDMDGDTGEAVRIHHHLVVSAGAKEAFVKKWTLGGVSWRMLSNQEDYTPIAAYFIRQVRHVPDAKKYTPARNLIRPQPRDRIVLTAAELRVPKGAKLLHRNEYKPNAPQYIRYVLPKKEGDDIPIPSAYPEGGEGDV